MTAKFRSFLSAVVDFGNGTGLRMSDIVSKRSEMRSRANEYFSGRAFPYQTRIRFGRKAILIGGIGEMVCADMNNG